MINQLNRRHFLKMLATGAAGLALAGCAPKQAPTAPAAEGQATQAPAAAAPAPKEKVKVTLWSSYSGANGEAEAAIVNEFNGGQDDVTLDYQFQGSYEECAQKLTAALQAKTEPDICLLSDVWWFKFYVNQAILPLDELASLANIDFTDYQDPLINEGLRNGSHWWIPFARSTPLFYYNKEMWSAAGLPDRGPDTWAEFMEWAPKLLKKEGDEIKVAALAHPDGASYVAWLFQGVAWQFGGKYSDPDFTMHMTDPDTVRAGQFYYDTVHTYGWAVPVKDMATDFVGGLTATAMMSTGSLGGLRANAPFEFGTAYLPKEKYFGCCTGGAGLSLIKGKAAEIQQAAMQYVAFATSPANTGFWSRSTGYMPVRKSSLQDAEMVKYFEEFPQFRTAVMQLELTQPQDSARVWIPNGDQILGKGLERITVQADDVATAFADVQEILVKEAEPVLAGLKAIEG